MIRLTAGLYIILNISLSVPVRVSLLRLCKNFI